MPTTQDLDHRAALLTPEEIAALAPGLTQPAAILRTLHADGFRRARIRHGIILLERAHFEAVCRGEFGNSRTPAHNEPKLRPIHA